jgi:hypothetical protein
MPRFELFLIKPMVVWVVQRITNRLDPCAIPESNVPV